MNKLIFKAIVGSQSYGTAVEGSDIDYKEVHIAPLSDRLKDQVKPQIEYNKDHVSYELGRFLDLLQTGNPTVLELLFTPEDCIEFEDPLFTEIKKHRNKFLTKKLKNSFCGYAYQQIAKADGLDKKMNWEKKEMIRKLPIDFCTISTVKGSVPLVDYLAKIDFPQELCGLSKLDNFRDGYNLWMDVNHWSRPHKHEPVGLKGIVLPDSNEIRVTELPEDISKIVYIGVVSYNKDGYTQHCNKYKEYQTWLKERNTQRYVDIEGHGQQIDGKNMLHCMRLIETGLEVAQGKGLNVRRPNAEYLISIRKGKVNLKDLLTEAKAKLELVKSTFDNCDLPDEISVEYVKDLQYQLIKEYYNV